MNGVDGVDGGAVGGDDYGVHDASIMVPRDNLFLFGAG